MASTVQLIPVVALLAVVVAIAFANAGLEVPDEAWLAHRWGTLAPALSKVEVLSGSTVFSFADATALSTIPDEVNTARFWIRSAFASASLSVPVEASGTFVTAWRTDTSALIIVPLVESLLIASIESSRGKADTSSVVLAPSVSIETSLWKWFTSAGDKVEELTMMAFWCACTVLSELL